jgi:hypothetical protein
MRFVSTGLGMLLAAGVIGALLAGCSHTITAPNAAPNVTPAEDRSGMIRWHQQHDPKPGSPAPGR